MTERQITLPDGRSLCYAAYGAPDGKRVLYFHGSPACRLEPLLIGEDALRRAGLCVVAPDRPGLGGSDFQPRRGFRHWPCDAARLADHLGWPKFSLLGNSGGAPYAAVCAAMIPERLEQVVIVSGGWQMHWPEARQHLPLPNRLTLSLARRAPWLLGWMLKAMTSGAMGTKEKELAQMRSHLVAADLAAFAVGDRILVLGRMLREAIRQGPRGAAWDLSLYASEFDFDLGTVARPLHFFHGEQDFNAPLPLVRKVMSLLPNAHLTTCPGEAHLSTLVSHFNAIADQL
ncbi:MAG: alpha/beta hydrolase [Opitutae bacterium]|nr:alpha/beta hydrolase [Opitutae bacterium]